MKSITKKLLALVLSAIVVINLVLFGTAEDKKIFDYTAYASVVTASDFQDTGSKAYQRFGRILAAAKADGMQTPDSVLVGGDYTKILYDNAVPGISQIRNTVLSTYPDANSESIACIQGNHDNRKQEFTETGFYNMGAYNLYVINEDDFPWKQSSKSDKGVKALAANVEACLDGMIKNHDKKPVIVLTHVPLHHTRRANGGDNMYSSYLFNVLNEKGKELDIIFLFGHNHSNTYDDYIGGSVNFMTVGDTIRIPLPDKNGSDCYTEETLNFTYTNCGYVGYSGNSVTETSTNVLTMGVIQFTYDSIHFVKYSENGVYSVKDIQKINKGVINDMAEYPSVDDRCICHSDNTFLQIIWKIWRPFARLFGANKFCTCGAVHY